MIGRATGVRGWGLCLVSCPLGTLRDLREISIFNSQFIGIVRSVNVSMQLQSNGRLKARHGGRPLTGSLQAVVTQAKVQEILDYGCVCSGCLGIDAHAGARLWV